VGSLKENRLKITVVANESGEVIAAVVHERGETSSPEYEGPRVKPSDNQSVVTVEAPQELADRTPDASYLDVLRQQYVVRNGSLERKQ
jgi:hypothetical protein